MANRMLGFLNADIEKDKKKRELEQRGSSSSSVPAGVGSKTNVFKLKNDQWYDGDSPTSARATARMYALTYDQPIKWDNAYAEMQTAKQTRGNVFYDPTSYASSSYMKTLNDYGVDTSNIDDNFWKQYEPMMQGVDRTNEGAVKSPTKKSSQQDAIAYALQGLWQDDQNTKKAEAEKSSLYEDVAYYAGRGLTDKEIKDKIGADFDKKYPTLAKISGMGAYDKELEYTRALNFGKDTVDGMIWAARNGDTSGDFDGAAVRYHLGQGKSQPRDASAVARRDPTSSEYNPYVDGMTSESYRRLYGRDSVTHDELMGEDRDKAMKAGADSPEYKAWYSAVQAEENTEAAEAALRSLTDWAGRLDTTDWQAKAEAKGMSLKEYAQYKLDQKFSSNASEYKALTDMDEGRITGKPVDLTRSVDYRYEDFVDYLVGKANPAKKTLADAMDEVTGVGNNKLDKGNYIPGEETGLDDAVNRDPNAPKAIERLPYRVRDGAKASPEAAEAYEMYQKAAVLSTPEQIEARMAERSAMQAVGTTIQFSGQQHSYGEVYAAIRECLDPNAPASNEAKQIYYDVLGGDNEGNVSFVMSQGGHGSSQMPGKTSFNASAYGDTISSALLAMDDATDSDRAALVAKLYTYQQQAQAEGQSLPYFVEHNDEVKADVAEINRHVDAANAASAEAEARRKAEEANARYEAATGLLAGMSSTEPYTYTPEQLSLYAELTNTANNDASWDAIGSDKYAGETLDGLDEIRFRLSNDWTYTSQSDLAGVQEEAERELMLMYRLANECGYDSLDAMFEAHPEMRVSADTLWKNAEASYAAKWSEENLTDEERHGLSLFSFDAIGAGVSTGVTNYQEGYVNAGIAMLDREDYEVSNANYATYEQLYGADASYNYALHVRTWINEIEDEGRRETFAKMLDDALANGRDVFNVPFNISTKDLQNVRDRMEARIEENDRFVREHGTKEEYDLYRTTSGVTTSLIQMPQNVALTALTGSPILASALTYGLPQFGDSYMELKDKVGVNRAKIGALANAAATVALESKQAEALMPFDLDAIASAQRGKVLQTIKESGLKGIAELGVRGEAFAVESAIQALGEIGQEEIENAVGGLIDWATTGDISEITDVMNPASFIDTAIQSGIASLFMSVESYGIGRGVNALAVEQPVEAPVSEPGVQSVPKQEVNTEVQVEADQQVVEASEKAKAYSEWRGEMRVRSKQISAALGDRSKGFSQQKYDAFGAMADLMAEMAERIAVESNNRYYGDWQLDAANYRTVANTAATSYANAMQNGGSPKAVQVAFGQLQGWYNELKTRMDRMDTLLQDRLVSMTEQQKAAAEQIRFQKTVATLVNNPAAIEEFKQTTINQRMADAELTGALSSKEIKKAVEAHEIAVAEVDAIKKEIGELTKNVNSLGKKSKLYLAGVKALVNGESLPENAPKRLQSMVASGGQTAIDGLQNDLKATNDALKKAKEDKARLGKELKEAQANAERTYKTVDDLKVSRRNEVLGNITDSVNASVDAIVANLTASASQVQQEKQQRVAEAVEARQVQQEEGNTRSLEADNFINEYFPDATDDERQRLYDRYVAYQDTGAKVTRDNVSFASAVSRRFGRKVGFVDSHGLFKGVLTPDGTIMLDKNATQGEAIKEVLTHELVHSAEKSRFYAEMENAVVDLAFGGSQEAFDSAVAEKTEEYRSKFNKDFDDGKQEVVAEQIGKLMDDSGLANRLAGENPTLAGRILESIRDFLRKIGAIKGSQMDQLRQLEKTLESALGDRAPQLQDGKPGATRYSLSDAELDDLIGSDRERIRESNYFARTALENGYAYYYTFENDDWTTPQYMRGIDRFDRSSLTRNEWAQFYEKIGEIKQGKEAQFHKAANGDKILAIGNKLVYTDGKWSNPKVNTVIAIGCESETAIDSVRDMIYMYEDGVYERHQARELVESVYGYESALRYDNPESRADEGKNGRGKRGDGRGTAKGSGFRYALEGDAEPTGVNANQRERQYATQTGQNAEINPGYVKQSLLKIPENRYYTPDSNEAQQLRAVERINDQGHDAVYDRLMNLDNMTADDVADAQVLQAIYFSEQYSDPERALSLASKYDQVGTVQAQGLQARKFISKMTPTGMQSWLASHYSKKTQEAMQQRPGAVDDAKKEAKRVEQRLKNTDATDQNAQLNEALSDNGEVVLPTDSNNRWNEPLNERQTTLIHELGLDKETRPGMFYNQATTNQRILESILMTADPMASIGNGMNLVEGIELMRHGLPVALPSDMHYITNQMRSYANYGEESQQDRGAQLALARAYESTRNIEPATFMDTMRSWRYTSMLLSIPSSLRNVMGNGLQNVVNAFAHDVVAVPLDKAISHFTGERTAANISISEKAEGWNEFAKETANTWKDHFVDRAITRPEGVHFEDSNRGRVFQNSVAEGMRTVESYLMSFGDRNFWSMAYANSMNEQRRLAEMNGVEFDQEAAAEKAENDANYAIFNEDSRVRDAIAKFRRDLGPIGGTVMDVVVPFTGVPTNITRRMIEYSPIGLATTLIRHGARMANGNYFDQAAFVNGMSRGITGTAAFLGGMAMYALGGLSLGTGAEDDKKKYGVETALGDQYSPYVTIFGQNVSLSALAPSVSPFIMGAAAAHAMEESPDLLSAVYSAFAATGDEILDASYLSSVQDIMNGSYSDSPVENALLSMGNSFFSQLIPAPISQLAAALDPYVRDTKDKNQIIKIVKGVMNKLPGLRGMLPEKVDVAGRTVQNSKYGIGAFVNPFSTTVADDDRVMRDMLAVADEIGDTSFMPSDITSFQLNKVKYNLNENRADHTEFMRKYGEAWRSEVSEYDMSGLDAEERAAAYSRITSEALKATKAWWAENHE